MRLEGPEPLVLLVTARRNPEHWIFPKGHVESGEDLADTALRELDEEAGVEGAILGRIGSSTFRSGGEDIEVTYFLVRATNEGHDREGRRRLWLPPASARARLSFSDARDLLDEAMAHLQPTAAMNAASSPAPGWRERLRRLWIKSVASGRYDRLEGGLRVAGEEIARRIAAIAVTDQTRWASSARRLLAEAQTALDRCDIDQGWRLLHAARRAEILALDEKELQHRATVLRAESDKLKSWRQKAVQRLLGTLDKPEASIGRGAVVEAATLRDEHYDNQAYKDQLLRTQMLALVLILAGVLVPLLFLVSVPAAVQGGGSSDVAEGDVARLGVVALFGLLGATVSGMLRASDVGQSARIPELTATIRVTFMRILMGGASAVMIYVFLRSSLGSALGHSLFSDGIAKVVEGLRPYTAYAIAFVAGFSERLVLRAVETVAGKGEDTSKTRGT